MSILISSSLHIHSLAFLQRDNRMLNEVVNPYSFIRSKSLLNLLKILSVFYFQDQNQYSFNNQRHTIIKKYLNYPLNIQGYFLFC